mgnify:CR=1 FL=1
MSTYGVEFYDNKGKLYLNADGSAIVKIVSHKRININTADNVHDEQINPRYGNVKNVKVYSYDFSNDLKGVSTFDIMNSGKTVFIPKTTFIDGDDFENLDNMLYYSWNNRILCIFNVVSNNEFAVGKDIDYILFGKI